MLMTGEFQILYNADQYFAVLKGAKDNCAVALNFTDSERIVLRVNMYKQEEQLGAIEALKTGTGKVLDIDFRIGEIEKDCYCVKVELFGMQIGFETDTDPDYTDAGYPVLIIPAKIFEKAEFDFVHQKVILTAESEKLLSLFERQTKKTREFLDMDGPWLG